MSRLLGRREEPPADPGRPTPDDLETVLAGRWVPERAEACWQVLESLVAHTAWGEHRLTIGDREAEEFDFALARAGAGVELGLGPLLRSDAMLSLPALPWLTVSHLQHDRVAHGARTLADLTLPDPDTARIADGFRAFLERCCERGEQAEAQGRPRPGTVAFWTHDPGFVPKG